MKRDVEKIFLRTVRERKLIPEGSTVWAAVSGGSDSVLMLRLLQRFSRSMEWKLRVVHVDHRVRPESGEDAGFVEALSLRLGLSFTLRRLEPPDGSAGEAWLSAERFRIYRETAGSAGLIAVGHTATDRAETLIMRLMEGSGLRGLGGMDYLGEGPVRRPMLDLTREEVRMKLADMGQEWVEDPTNEDGHFLRNRIRNSVLPVLEETSPGSVLAIARSASVISGWRDVADGVTEMLVEGMMASGELGVREYASIPPVLRLGLLWAVSGRPRSGRAELEKADRWLCRGRKGEHPLPGGAVVRSDGRMAVLLHPSAEERTEGC